jgi:hypothetical protein
LDKKGTNIFQIPLQGSVDPETHFFLRDLLSGASWTEHHAEFILTFLVSDLPQEKWGYRSKESMDDEAGRGSRTAVMPEEKVPITGACFTPGP